MIYINENHHKYNRDTRVGWVITESTPDINILQRPNIEKDANGRPIGTGTLQRMNAKNRNGRFYDDKDLGPQLLAKRILELLRSGFGSENGHPLSKDLTRQQTIDPNNTVAFFLKIWTDGDLIKAKYRGSNLPIGDAFTKDMLDGFFEAWSLRALGSIENTNRGAEVKGIKIITWDRVYFPSHPEAYADGMILTESGISIPEKKIHVMESASEEEKEVMENGIIAPIMNQSVLDCIQQESYSFNQIVNEFEIFYDNISLNEDGTKVHLSNSNTGNVFVVNLEAHIHNEIMNYCSK